MELGYTVARKRFGATPFFATYREEQNEKFREEVAELVARPAKLVTETGRGRVLTRTLH